MIDGNTLLIAIGLALTLWIGQGIKHAAWRLFHRPGPEVQTSTTITDAWRSLMPEPYRTDCRDVGWFFRKNTTPNTFMRVNCPIEGKRGFHPVDLHFVQGTREKEGHVEVRKE